MAATTNMDQARFEIYTDPDRMLELYQQLEDAQDLSAFEKYKSTVPGTIYNAMNRANTYVILAYGSNDEVWGISTGEILDENTAKSWWTIRANHEHLRGFGSLLMSKEREFLLEEGVSSICHTAETEYGRTLIIKNGGEPSTENNEFIRTFSKA